MEYRTNYTYGESDRISRLINELSQSGGLDNLTSSLYTLSFSKNKKASASSVNNDCDALEVSYYQIDAVNCVQHSYGSVVANRLNKYRVTVITRSSHAPKWFELFSSMSKSSQQDHIKISQFVNIDVQTSNDVDKAAKPNKYATIKFNSGVFSAYITYKSSVVYGNVYGITFFVGKLSHKITQYGTGGKKKNEQYNFNQTAAIPATGG